MIVLASASPRRRRLLDQLGVQYTAVPSGAEIDFNTDGLPPPTAAKRLALAKAMDVSRGYSDYIVLGADTVVVVDDRVLGKPKDADAAAAMLERLQGRRHRVITGVALVWQKAERQLVDYTVTTVTMRSLTRRQIRRYVDTGEPLDKAGSYAIQGRGAALVESIDGCYYNVVGLPLSRVVCMLAELGMEV